MTVTESNHNLRGGSDRNALCIFRDEFTKLEQLATATVDDPINPMELNIVYADGIGKATEGRFDVKWSTTDDYNIHYTDDEGRDLRWDSHPHSYPAPSGDQHFHPPPNASSDDRDVEDSCIDVTRIQLVARATVKVWREMYERGSMNDPNGLVDPP